MSSVMFPSCDESTRKFTQKVKLEANFSKEKKLLGKAKATESSMKKLIIKVYYSVASGEKILTNIEKNQCILKNILMLKTLIKNKYINK